MLPRIKTILSNQPYSLFVLAALILLAISLFVRERIIDIHAHDTMYVITLAYILWAITILFLLIWTIYKLAAKILLSNYLTWFHVIVTLAFFFFLIIISLVPATPPVQELNRDNRRQEIQREQIIYGSILVLFIVAQICFLVNLVGGLLRGRNQRL